MATVPSFRNLIFITLHFLVQYKKKHRYTKIYNKLGNIELYPLDWGWYGKVDKETQPQWARNTIQRQDWSQPHVPSFLVEPEAAAQKEAVWIVVQELAKNSVAVETEDPV